MMASDEDVPSEGPGAAAEPAPLPSSDEPVPEPDDHGEPGGRRVADLVRQGQDLAGTFKSRSLIVAGVAAGLTAAAIIGAKIAYDRRNSASGYAKAVRRLEDAREALIAAAAELPEQGRAVLHRVTRR